MTKAATNPPGTRGGNVPESGEPAPPGLSLFGISPARILKIPLKHWQVSICLLALCALCAYMSGTLFTKEYYKATGRLGLTPWKDQDIRPGKDVKTLTKEIENESYYGELNTRFGLDIRPEIFRRNFAITNLEDTTLIEITIQEWPDSETAAKLVNGLMEIYRDAVAADRKKDVDDALTTVAERFQSCAQRLAGATAAAKKVLDDTGFSKKYPETDPKTKRERLEKQMELAEAGLALVRGQDRANLLAVQNAEAALKQIKRDIETRKTTPSKTQADDPAGELARLQFKSRVLRDTQEVERCKVEHDKATSLYKANDGLVAKGIITRPQWNEIVGSKKNAEKALKVALDQLDLTKKEAALSDPGMAKLLQAYDNADRKLDDLKQLQQTTKLALDQQQEAWQKLVDQESYVAMVLREWRLKANDVAEIETEKLELGKRKTQLGLRLAAGKELDISARASPSVFKFHDRSKKQMMGFAVSLLVCFVGLAGFEMASRGWRAETLAERLQLPVVARASGGGRRGGSPGDLSAHESRALSFRIRQAVPERGQVVLLSSLNDGEGIERLATDLSAYFAVRNEKVLILDARIARPRAESLAGLIEARSGSAPLETHLTVEPRPAVGAALAGLVQTLVFDGQDCANFIHRTQIAGVDHLPAGGPFPVTDALASEPMEELLTALRQRYTLILMVGPALSLTVDTEILAAYMDGMVVLVNEPLGSSTPDVEELMRSLKESGAPLVGAVICV